MDYEELDQPMEAIREPLRPSRTLIDQDELGRLADDIAANGLHQRPGVKRIEGDDAVRIVYGHRRYLAFKLLGRSTMPVKVYPPGADELQIRMAENEMRADLNPIEQAHLCAEFVARGEPRAGIARHFRRSPGWVDSRLALLDLQPDVQEALSDGVITVGVAHELARVDHADYRLSLIAEAVRTGATQPTAAVWAAHYMADRERMIHNHVTIAEMATRRETYKITAECAICHEDHELHKTQSLRCCERCMSELARAIAAGAG